MSPQTEDNKAVVRRYMDAFATYEPSRFLPYVADDPTYMVGTNVRRGREAFVAISEMAKVLYPRPETASNEPLAVTAEGDWVAVLFRRRAATNKVADYDNVYAMFFELSDGRIKTLVELMDFRVAADKFDLSALGGA